MTEEYVYVTMTMKYVFTCALKKGKPTLTKGRPLSRTQTHGLQGDMVLIYNLYINV